jgi:iron complex outermembrane receptor protein
MKPRRSITRSRLSAAVLAATCPAAEAAYAQGRATPVVEEVVVTAQKRAERLVDVPIAITAASGDTLERVGITRLEEISQIAPAAQISRIGTYVQPAIRGVTTPLTGVGAENNVAIYIDGFYQAFQRGLNLDLANVAQVQILKGPQGTLFGRNTTGGAFLIDTLQPSLADRNGRFSLSYARFDDIQAQAYFSTPLSSTLAFNIMGYVRKSDGYIKDVRGFDTAPISNHSVNAKLLWAPSDALSVTASIENVKVSDGTSLAPTIIARSQAQSLVPTTYVETGRNRTSVNHPVTDRSVQWAGSLKAQYRTDWATLSSFTRYGKEWDYLDFENDGSTVRVFDNITKETGRAFSQEANLTSAGSEPVSWVLGAFYFHSRGTFPLNQIISYPATGYIAGNGSFKYATAYAVYADATWHAAEKLYLTAGVRYSDERKRQRTYNGARVETNRSKVKWDAITPRAVVRYELAQDTNVYASYSKGFKSGAINTSAPFNLIEPEKLTAWEGGFKRATSRYRFDASAYHYDYKNIQVTSIVVLPAGNLASVPSNAASGRIYGAEAQLTAQVSENFGLRASVAYTHGRYRSFPAATISPPNPITGLNTTTCTNRNPPPATIPCTEDQSGARMLRAPDWSFNLGGDYTIPTQAGDIVLTANAAYTSRYAPSNTALALTGSGQRYEQPGTTIINVRAAWRTLDKHWTFSIFGNNLTDERYFVVLSGNAFGDARIEGKPRTWGARADYQF